jgi:ATP-dependent helicase/nuclease subunit A
MAAATPESVVLELEVATGSFTDEQLVAIERRDGDLLLDASAGSGKTSVLVERFARSVLEDGIDVAAILTITFTEKAAAEMRDRIRRRLRELDADEAARATEGAFISTIHGFCARLLRSHALSAGLDPAFVVLDSQDAERLADVAFDEALEELGRSGPPAIDLIASYSPGGLRGAIFETHAELRSRGERRPRLPALAPAPDLDALRGELERAGAAALAELGAIERLSPDPPVKVLQAISRLERLPDVIAGADPWPGDLWGVGLPGGNGAALCTDTCVRYAEALTAFRVASEHRRAARAHELLDRLLALFGERYARAKRDASGLDFEDLELECRELLRANAGLRERYRERFARIMVDELQDTNRVQLELIDLVANDNLFTVGDAQQSIYGFRHADVELFERLGQQLADVGARATLDTNFRSRPEILNVINGVFEKELGEQFRPLQPGRPEAPAGESGVELLVADKGADWAMEGLGAPWRVAEARALAARVGRLLDHGTAPREIVLLTRATTDLRVYERALEDRGIPTYVIGGRGYWAHPQVIDMVSYLEALANPREEEALYTVLASPLVGISADALVVLAAAARRSETRPPRDPWLVLRDPGGSFDELDDRDRDLLGRFADWFAIEREVAARAGVERLIDRVVDRTGYDLAVLAMPGGQRRLANVRKLMRLAREHEAAHGPDLRGFLELVTRRARAAFGAGDARESEAPVEGEALDAVRLMTIHRAKGLEFEVVCVADLGRGPRWRAELIRVGRDGRFGLRLAEPGTGRRESALDYKALGEERVAAEAREERRLFYVAMTRARERLILSGAAKLEAWPGLENGGGGGPIAWIGPAVEQLEGVEVTFVRPEDVPAPVALAVPDPVDAPPSEFERAAPAPPDVAAPPVSALSYSSLAAYRRCGYRFYAERVLRLPELPGDGGSGSGSGGASAGAAIADRPGGLSALDRGTLVHALLERLDFRRPRRPTDAMIALAAERSGLPAVPAAEDAGQVAELVERFAGGELCGRLARATAVRREARFRFLLSAPRPPVLIGGVFDVIAREPGGRTLVVDYKTDRLEGADPQALADGSYGTQRVVYALAALRAGATEVEVVHTFLELPQRPAAVTFTREQAPALEEQLTALARGVLNREFKVTDAPQRAVCDGCPAEGGLCSWPIEMTRREAPDRLF